MTHPHRFKIRAKVWLYSSSGGGWHFVTLPKKLSAQIRQKFELVSAGWVSLPVKVALGNTAWKTSIFPDKKRAAYLLPIKAGVRKTENIHAGNTVTVQLEVAVS